MTDFELTADEPAPEPSSAIAEFLFPTPAPRSVGGIFKWWEKRRLAYNLIVGGSGLLSTLMMAIISSIPPGGLPETVWVPFWAMAIFGGFANLFYFLGPAVETLFLKVFKRSVLPVGPALYRMGLTLGVGLTLLPTLMYMVMWVARTVGFIF